MPDARPSFKILPALVEFGSVRLVIDQEIFHFGYAKLR